MHILGINKEEDGKYLCSMWVAIEIYLFLVGVDIAIYGIYCEDSSDDDRRCELLGSNLSLLD